MDSEVCSSNISEDENITVEDDEKDVNKSKYHQQISEDENISRDHDEEEVNRSVYHQ